MSKMRQEETLGSLQEPDLQPPALSGENDPSQTLLTDTKRCRSLNTARPRLTAAWDCSKRAKWRQRR